MDRRALVQLCLVAALSVPSMASAQYLGTIPQTPDVMQQPVPSGPYLPVPRPQPQQEVFSFLGIRLFSTVGPTEASNDPAPPPSQTARRPGRPELLGDMPPLPVVVRRPDGGFVAVPSVRSFKIGDFESPEPQDRMALLGNYFTNLYGSLNRSFGANVSGLSVTKQTLIYESAMPDGSASFGVRVPTFATDVSSAITDLTGSRTALGDTSLIAKFALCDVPDQGLFLSGGLAVTVPTGADSLVGNNRYARVRCVYLQPFVGYRWQSDALVVLGFSSVDVPTNWRDATLLFNDLTARLRVYENGSERALVSTVVLLGELHLTTPLNHQGILRGTDPNGTPDLVDVTAGLEARIFRRVKAVVGVAAPLAGPKLFDLEVLSQLRFDYQGDFETLGEPRTK